MTLSGIPAIGEIPHVLPEPTTTTISASPYMCTAIVPLSKNNTKKPKKTSKKAKMLKYIGNKLSYLSPITRSREKKFLEMIAGGNVGGVMEALANDMNPNAKTSAGLTGLYIAASRGHHEILSLLLEHGAVLDQCSAERVYCPVYGACEAGEMVSLQILIKSNAALDSISSSVGFAPLHIACKKGHFSIVEVLLKHQVDVNQTVTHRGMTPLMLAAGKGAADIVEVLLNFKADVHLEDKFGNTALHYACEDGNFRTTHLILTAGADPFMPNFNEETAFDIADANRHSHISYLLETSNLNSNSYSNSDGPTQKDPIQEQMDTQLNETLAKHSHEIARIILKNRIKYAKFLLLGKIIEDMPVEVFEDPLLDDEDFV